jgi:hypothetical protein
MNKTQEVPQGLCHYSNRLGSTIHIDNHGNPMCGNALCNSPMPTRNNQELLTYHTTWFVPRLKSKPTGHNHWLCNLDWTTNGKKVRECISEFCTGKRSENGIAI